jgi:hypothetical protein
LVTAARTLRPWTSPSRRRTAVADAQAAGSVSSAKALKYFDDVVFPERVAPVITAQAALVNARYRELIPEVRTLMRALLEKNEELTRMDTQVRSDFNPHDRATGYKYDIIQEVALPMRQAVAEEWLRRFAEIG